MKTPKWRYFILVKPTMHWSGEIAHESRSIHRLLNRPDNVFRFLKKEVPVPSNANTLKEITKEEYQACLLTNRW